MSLEERQIEVAQLAAGMYVCRLDRPWTETPFPLQGFLIEGDDQIAALRRYCRRVWIDVQLGRVPPDKPAPYDAADPLGLSAIPGRVVHTDLVSHEEEVPLARGAQLNAARLTTQILDDLRAGRKLSSQHVYDAVEPVVRSVLRSADAMFWVNALQQHDSYSYSHAINCCALAAAFGRHLGLPETMLMDLASGGLLLDVGKAQLPVELFSHPGVYDADQTRQVRTHVELSLRILRDSELDRPDVYEMIRTHHERYDGSGYPGNLRGTWIPLFGRMAAIIDSFDAMITERPHARAISRHDALQQLYRHRDTLFQDELVEQFTGCLGVYPVGSLVELSSGEVGVVMAQNPTRRLRPRILLLTGEDKRLRDGFVPLDLMHETRDGGGIAMHIVRPLPAGAYQLNPAELYL